MFAQADYVLIAQNRGGFTGNLDSTTIGIDLPDQFGSAIVGLGDLDGDGIDDIAVGAPGDDDGGTDLGAVWILFMTEGGTVRDQQKISALRGGLRGLALGEFRLGGSLAKLGRDESTNELVMAVSSWRQNRGHILFLGPDGTVMKQKTINNLPGGLGSVPWRLANVGDLDGNGAPDLGVGSVHAGGRVGGLLLLLLESDYTVHDQVLITTGLRGFNGQLADLARFGGTVTPLGDVDGDGQPDLAVGNVDLGPNFLTGELWILHLDGSQLSGESNTPSVKSYSRINGSYGGFEGPIETGDSFTTSVANMGDLDGNGVDDLAVGASGDDDLDRNKGAVWILYLKPDGTVKGQQKISGASQGLDEWDLLFAVVSSFGRSVSNLGDLDGDGVPELAVGADFDNGRGCVVIFYGLANLQPGIGPVRRILSEETAARTGEAISVQTTVVAATKPDVKLNFRRGGDPSFFGIKMTDVGDGLYEGTIPAIAVGSRGIEYYVSAETAGLVGRVESRRPRSTSAAVAIAVPDGLAFFAPSGAGTADYRLVSVPLELDTPSVLTVLESNLGDYSDGDWRLFGLDRGQVVELSGQNLRFNPGKAFWMLSRESNQVVHTGAGTTVSTAGPFMIPLDEGWNLVGDPFNFEIPVENVALSSGEQAELLTYDGSFSIEREVIRPFEGYAVKAEEIDTLYIDPDLTPPEVDRPDSGPERPTRRTSDARGAETALLPSAEQVADLESMMRKLGGASGNGNAQVPIPDAQLSAYPNPFSQEVYVTYKLDRTGHVLLEAHDLLGRRVATLIDEQQESGFRSVRWEAMSKSELADGIYILQLQAGDTKASSTVVLVR